MLRVKKIKKVGIAPQCNCLYFEIEYVYLQESENPELNKNSYFSIDLGLNNFITCISTNGTSFIIEGKGIKSFNRWWNKEKAKLQSIYDKQKIKKGIKLCYLFRKRKNVINEFMNKSAYYIIQYCLENNIRNIIIGELKNIKQNIILGEKITRISLASHTIFSNRSLNPNVNYSSEYIETSESYTSQECSQCGVIDKTNRKHRGLYVCKACGNVLNADVNGAINILRKVAPDALPNRRFLCPETKFRELCKVKQE